MPPRSPSLSLQNCYVSLKNPRNPSLDGGFFPLCSATIIWSWLRMIPYTIADENTSKSPYSPGIVKSTETLLHLGFDPEHMKDGKIGPAAIPRRDLNERGFSVDRQAYAKRQVIEDRTRDQMTRRQKKDKKPLFHHFLVVP